MKELDGIARTIDENENFTAQGVASHLRTHHTAKRVKAFSHIGGSGTQIILKIVREGKHTLKDGDQLPDQIHLKAGRNRKFNPVGIGKFNYLFT